MTLPPGIASANYLTINMSISMRIALNQKGSALGDFGAPRFAFDQTGTRFAGLCYKSTKARKYRRPPITVTMIRM